MKPILNYAIMCICAIMVLGRLLHLYCSRSPIYLIILTNAMLYCFHYIWLSNLRTQLYMTPEKSCVSEFSIYFAVINTAFYSDTMANWQCIVLVFLWPWMLFPDEKWYNHQYPVWMAVFDWLTTDVQILLGLHSMQPFLIWFLFEEVFYGKKSAAGCYAW